MLEKILSIKNVAKFSNYNAVGDTSFRETTLIFGENGIGKSTIASILRSLSTNDPTVITAKKTVTADNDPVVELRTSTRNIKFDNGIWDYQLPNIHIFDSHFVNSNVFSGDHVDSDHRKSLYHLVIGDQGVALAQRIGELDSSIRSLLKDLQDLSSGIEASMANSMDINEYINLEMVEDVDTQITSQKQEITALLNAQEINDRPLMSSLALPEFPFTEFTQVVGVDLELISKDAESAVLEHLSNLTDGASLWIEQGRSYVLNSSLEDCPFCGQALAGLHLLDHYRQFFTEEYERSKSTVRDFSKQIEDTFNQDLIDVCSSSLTSNRINHEFWKTHLAYDFPEISDDFITTTINNLREETCRLLQLKQSSILDHVELPDSCNQTYTAYCNLIVEVEAFNSQLEVLNELISALKLKSDPTKLPDAEKELDRLENVKKRYSEAVIPLCDSYMTISNSIDLQRQEKEQTRTNLDAYSSASLSAYQASINRFLNLTSDIQIVDIGTSHIGGRPRAEYYILINGVSIPLGSDRVIDRASFTTTLSDGDKNTLAFAFFIALLEGDPYLSDKIVIIDDPITSLDRNRRFCTSQEIVSLANRCHQLIVMSHEPFFLFDISRNIASSKHLEIYRSASGSELREWEISESVKSDLRKNYDCLRRFADSGEGNTRLIATTIRIYLEGFLRIKYPDEFPDSDWLGDFITRILESAPGDPLHPLQGASVTELEYINNYSKRFHHNQNPNAGSEPINEAELETYVRRTLDLQKVL